jgi:DnaJ homolog subfamily C member 25
MRLLCGSLIYFAILFLVSQASAEDDKGTTNNASIDEGVKPENGGQDTQAGSESTTARKKKRKIADDFDVKNEDWGTYYDPQSVFCGKFDCYKILGFDYESYNKVKPTTKEITQRYRRLGREWHPDKSKHKNAKERFVKIARAYEVLTDIATRKEYDTLRYDQAAYVAKYGSSVMWQYAPKTDLTIVVLIVLLIGNIVSWYTQKHRWSMVADRLVKAAVEDWAPRDGGSPESKQLREEALAILAKRESKNSSAGVSDDAAPEADIVANGKTLKKKSSGLKAAKVKVAPKEKKKLEQEALLPIITELVNEMEDFGGGFHKPTYQDLLIVSMVKVPFKIVTGTIWQANYFLRRLQKKELSLEEKEVLTERSVGPVVWNTTTEDDRAEMVSKELWISENLVQWNEEQEIKKLTPAEQKLYSKLKKKGKLDKFDKLE